MEVWINSCNILVEPWQFQCCGDAVYTNSIASLTVDQYSPKVLGEWLNIDFMEDHHDIGFLQLKGRISCIKAIFKKNIADTGCTGEPKNEYYSVDIPYFNGNERHECYEEYAHLCKRPAYYLVTMEGALLTPIKDSISWFSITTSDIECGWEDVALNLNGAIINFDAGYCADEPINSFLWLLSEVKEMIDDGATGKASYEIHWDSEPKILMIRAEVARDNLVILYFLLEPFYVPDKEIKRIWRVTMPYHEFHDAVMSAATRQLMRQGIVGIAQSWSEQGDSVFPIRKFLEILGSNATPIDNQIYRLSSNIFDELELIKLAIQREQVK